MVLVLPPGKGWRLDETPVWKMGVEFNKAVELMTVASLSMYNAWAYQNEGSPEEQIITEILETTVPPVLEFWDESRELARDGNDFVEAVQDAPAALFADLLTEVLSIVGSSYATLVNKMDIEIDDLARLPIALDDVSSLFLPQYKGNFSTILSLTDLPSIFSHLMHSTKTFSEAPGTMNGLLKPTTLILPDSSSGTRSSLFRWKGGTQGGVWS